MTGTSGSCAGTAENSPAHAGGIPAQLEAQERFRAACDRIITLEARLRHGIGMQKEKTVHAVLKFYEEPDEDCHEIPVNGYIADIFNARGITEIQTAHFHAMRDKLRAFLPEYPVRIVHPIPHEKWITWVDPETGHLEKRSRSPKKGKYLDAVEELISIRGSIADPHLSVKLILLDMEEYRIRDGWGGGGKRGSHRYDRIPTAVRGEMVLAGPRDYMQLLPAELPDEFTARQFAEAAGAMRDDFRSMLWFLEQTGTVRRTGEKKGNAILYRMSGDDEEPDTGQDERPLS